MPRWNRGLSIGISLLSWWSREWLKKNRRSWIFARQKSNSFLYFNLPASHVSNEHAREHMQSSHTLVLCLMTKLVVKDNSVWDIILLQISVWQLFLLVLLLNWTKTTIIGTLTRTIMKKIMVLCSSSSTAPVLCGWFSFKQLFYYMENKFLYDVFNAYYDARRNKRNTNSQLEFEVDYESNLLKLYKELLDGTYKIWSSTCFLICDTVPREIFAADFRDRIVHHLVYNYIYNICDTQFIHDSYSCRIGKGTHYGVRRVELYENK